MHELGVVLQIVKTVEDFCIKNNLTTVDTLVLQIGELSQVVPHYVEDVYPIAVEKSMLKDTKLKIEILPGNGRCTNCGHVFNLRQHNNKCPKCNSSTWDVLSGTEFFIKEVIAY